MKAHSDEASKRGKFGTTSPQRKRMERFFTRCKNPLIEKQPVSLVQPRLHANLHKIRPQTSSRGLLDPKLGNCGEIGSPQLFLVYVVVDVNRL